MAAEGCGCAGARSKWSLTCWGHSPGKNRDPAGCGKSPPNLREIGVVPAAVTAAPLWAAALGAMLTASAYALQLRADPISAQLIVRPTGAHDYQPWLMLWRRYCAALDGTVSDAITESVWSRMLLPMRRSSRW